LCLRHSSTGVSILYIHSKFLFYSCHSSCVSLWCYVPGLPPGISSLSLLVIEWLTLIFTLVMFSSTLLQVSMYVARQLRFSSEMVTLYFFVCQRNCLCAYVTLPLCFSTLYMHSKLILFLCSLALFSRCAMYPDRLTPTALLQAKSDIF
jgi:hypothetical protein